MTVSRRVVWPLAVLVPFALVGCSSKLSGSVTVTKADKTSFTITPDACVSGERTGYAGVDLSQGSGDKIVRLINDPKDGYYLKVNVPGSDRAIGMNSKTCSAFDVRVARQNSSINGIHNVEGHVNVTCDVKGVKVVGKLTFKNCH